MITQKPKITIVSCIKGAAIEVFGAMLAFGIMGGFALYPFIYHAIAG